MPNRRKEALDYHTQGRPGKIEVVPTKPVMTARDLSLAYSPGVAEPCREIEKNPDDVFKYTARGNLVAVVSNGTLIRGYNGGGGEVGHIPISDDGPLCGCGARGCLESYVGTAGIRHYVEREYPNINERSIKTLNEMAKNGNRDAIAVFAWIGKMLGIALTGLVNVFNPEMIIIGGGIAAAGDILFKPLEKELRKRAFKAYTNDLTIRPAELGNWAGVVGAGMLQAAT